MELLVNYWNHRIDVTKCRGQCHDGATAMSPEKIGVQIKVESENIVHTHFNSHVLNPSKAASYKMPSMRNMIDNVIEISLFFGTSPKRRWIERHHSTNFLGLSLQHKNLLSSIEIEAVDLPVEWDRKTRVKAQGLLCVMKSSSFLVAFITVKNV